MGYVGPGQGHTGLVEDEASDEDIWWNFGVLYINEKFRVQIEKNLKIQYNSLLPRCLVLKPKAQEVGQESTHDSQGDNAARCKKNDKEWNEWKCV